MFQHLVNRPLEERVKEIIVNAVEIEQVNRCNVSMPDLLDHSKVNWVVYSCFTSVMFVNDDASGWRDYYGQA